MRPGLQKCIVLIGINYAPETTGVAPYSASLAAGLVEAGANVAVVTAQPHYPQWQVHEGYRRWRSAAVESGVSVRRHLHFVPRSANHLVRAVSELSFGARALFAKWGKSEVVILVSPALFASVLVLVRARLRRRKVILWVQDLYGQGLAETTGSSGVVGSILSTIERFLFRSVDDIVVIHDQFREAVQRTVKGATPVHVVRNWSHIGPVFSEDREATRKQRGWTDRTVVLHAGNQGAKQGLENVIEAGKLAAELDDNKLLFVLMGDGNQHAALLDAAKGVEAVQFIEPLPDAEYLAALASADVLLVNELPGVQQMAVPSKLTSYFAAELPVIAATHPEGTTAAEMTAAGAGLVVPAGDPAALVAAALAIDADPQAARVYGRSGRAFAKENLSRESAVDAWIKLLT